MLPIVCFRIHLFLTAEELINTITKSKVLNINMEFTAKNIFDFGTNDNTKKQNVPVANDDLLNDIKKFYSKIISILTRK